MKFRLIIFIVIYSNLPLYSQQFADQKFYLIDSINLENHDNEEIHLIKKNLHLFHKTKNEIQQLKYLSNITNNSNDVELWPRYNEIIITKCQKLLFKKTNKKEKKIVSNYLTDAYNDKAFIIAESGNKKEAIHYFIKAILIAQKNKEKKKLVNCYNNLGNVYSVQGNIPIALKYTFKSLKIAEEIKDFEGIAIAYSNLGVIYDQQDNIEKATEYYLKGLEIQKKNRDISGIATSYNNLGFIYNKKSEFDKAIYYYKRANDIYTEIEEFDGMSASFSNIGSIYFVQGNIEKAILFFNRALEIDKKINNPKGIAYSFSALGRIYKSEKKFNLSKQYFENALKIAQEVGASEVIQISSESLFSIYSYEKNWQKAFEVQSLYFKMRDSINNLSNQKESITLSIKYDFDKQQSLNKKENEKKLAVAEEKSKRQFFIIIFGVLGFILVSLFSYFMYKRFKISQLQNIKIKLQKEIIEEKQQEINDSISYAERIQKSFLASDDVFSNNLLSDYFIYFNPKDIVSGDFYWAHNVNNKIYICLADSTGHGIPGAFMSLLNISLLNEGLLSKGIEEPNLLLDFVRKILIIGLKPDESGHGGNDGMDCSCISIDQESLLLTFSGANNPLWIIREGKLIVLKPDKMPVGRSPKQNSPFTAQEFQLIKGDRIYLFSDGYPDQFGGPKGKKFKYKAFEEMILNNVEFPMLEQRKIFDETFETWKGNLEQVDDVCVIGLQVKS